MPSPPETPKPAAPLLGGLPRQYWILWAGMLVNRIGGFVLPLLALYLAQERHLSDERVGYTIALFGIGSVLGNQVGGSLADRVGRRVTLLGGLALGAGAMLLLGIVTEPGPIALATFALGLFGESYRPAMQAMVADLVPPADRARAYALSYWANNLGFAIAALLAGLLSKVSFFLLFVGDAGTTLAYAAVVLLFIRESRPAVAKPRAALSSLLVPFQDKVFLPFWLLSIATSSVFMQHVVSLPLAMKHDGLTSAEYGRVIALNGILIVFVQPWLQSSLDRTRRSTLLAIGTAVIGAGFGLTAFAHTAPLYALTVAIWTLGEIAVLPTASAVVADLAPPDLRGTYQGMQNIAWGLAWVVGPVVGTQALATFGSGLWAACFAVGLLVSLGHALCARARERRLAELATETIV